MTSWWQDLTPEQAEALLARAGGTTLAELVSDDQHRANELREGSKDESLSAATRGAYTDGLDAREELVRLHLARENVVAHIALVRGVALSAAMTVYPEDNRARYMLAMGIADAITGSGLAPGVALDVCADVLAALRAVLHTE